LWVNAALEIDTDIISRVPGWVNIWVELTIKIPRENNCCGCILWDCYRCLPVAHAPPADKTLACVNSDIEPVCSDKGK
jgi:hypothetical protein